MSYRNLFEGIFSACAGVALTMLVVLTVGDIIGRTFFKAGIIGSMTIVTQIIFPMIVFFSLPCLARTGGHVSVDILGRYLNRMPIIKFVDLFVSEVFLLLLAVGAIIRIVAALEGGYGVVSGFEVPILIPYGIIFLGAAGGCIAHYVWRRSK